MDKKLVGLMLIFMLSFALFTTITVFNKPLTRFTKAKEEFIPSSDATLLFVFPLTSKADGKSIVQVNVFVRNATTGPLPNKNVHLTSTLGTIKANDIATDKAGKATFILTSNEPGTAKISALIDNKVQINKQVSVVFQ